MRLRTFVGVLVTVTGWAWCFAAQEVDEPSPDSARPPVVETQGDKFLIPLPEQEPGELVDSGSLAIQAVQGTPDGGSVGGSKVEIDLYRNKEKFKTMEAQLDEHGVLVLEDLPIEGGVTPVVRVIYKGFKYQEIGAVLDQNSPRQKLEVKVWETTQTPPDWHVVIRQVMVKRSEIGVKVTEVVVIQHPGDRTWLGTVDAQSKRVTTQLNIPESAERVTLGKGFFNWTEAARDRASLVNRLPLMPGMTELNFEYLLRARNGSAELSVSSPVLVEKQVVIVPDDIGVSTFSGLTLDGSSKIGDTEVRLYTADGLEGGTPVAITLTNLSDNTSSPMESSHSPGWAQRVAFFGGGLILLAAVIVVFVKARPMAEG